MSTPPLSGLSILVVEGKGVESSDLRSSLIRLGANVHVVRNVQTGLMVAQRKRLHGAILDCISLGPSLSLCGQLALDKVPFMFYGGGSADEEAGNFIDLMSFHDRKHAQDRRQKVYGSGDDYYLTTV